MCWRCPRDFRFVDKKALGMPRVDQQATSWGDPHPAGGWTNHSLCFFDVFGMISVVEFFMKSMSEIYEMVESFIEIEIQILTNVKHMLDHHGNPAWTPNWPIFGAVKTTTHHPILNFVMVPRSGTRALRDKAAENHFRTKTVSNKLNPVTCTAEQYWCLYRSYH